MAKIEENIINNSTPGEFKKRGIEALIALVTNQAMLFSDRLIPSLEKQLIKVEGDCPTREELSKVISIRNNILDQANSIAKILKGVTFTVDLARLGINTLVKLITALKRGRIAVSIISKLIPFGLPGAIPASLNDLDTLITSKTFDKFGNPKIPPVRTAINSISIPLALISFYINEFIVKLKLLDDNINKCRNVILPQPDEALVEISTVQRQAEESVNLSTYQGFVFEIEEVPFSPTINRKRALGKNDDGITLIQTELSFTPSDKVLIDELKFIIDRDNLKAY